MSHNKKAQVQIQGPHQGPYSKRNKELDYSFKIVLELCFLLSLSF